MNVHLSGATVRAPRPSRNTEHVSDEAIREAMAAVGYLGPAAALVGLTKPQMAWRVRRLGLARAARGRPRGPRPVACETGGAACSGCGGDRCWTRGAP